VSSPDDLGLSREAILILLNRSLQAESERVLVVNGRPMPMEAVAELVEQLGDDSRIRSRGVRITIEPDPFGGAGTLSGTQARASESPALVRRILERQHQADALDGKRASGRWRQLLGRALGR
jgi:hypothetical protein